MNNRWFGDPEASKRHPMEIRNLVKLLDAVPGSSLTIFSGHVVLGASGDASGREIVADLGLGCVFFRRFFKFSLAKCSG